MSREKSRESGNNYQSTRVSKTATYVGPLAFLILTQQPGFSASVPNATAMVGNLPRPKPDVSLAVQQPRFGTITASALSRDASTYDPILVPSYPARTAWYQKTLEKIDAMQNMASDWDTYGAEPPTEASLAKAEAVVETLYGMNFQPSRIAPSAEGGVAISFFDKQKYCDIEIFNSGEVLAATSLGVGNPYVWEVSAEDSGFVKTMKVLRDFIRAK